MEPIYRKLNYLVAQTAPNYKGTRMRTPYMKLTVGDWFNRLPGVLSSVSLNWSKDYPWEIKLDENSQDEEMLRLPHVLDVSVSFLPIHSMRPENEIDTPFINIDNWLNYGVADYTKDTLGDYTVEDFKKGKWDEDTPTIQPTLGGNNFEKVFHKNQREHIELIQPTTNVPKDLNFTQKWNKFKENLNNEGLLGIVK